MGEKIDGCSVNVNFLSCGTHKIANMSKYLIKKIRWLFKRIMIELYMYLIFLRGEECIIHQDWRTGWSADWSEKKNNMAAQSSSVVEAWIPRVLKYLSNMIIHIRDLRCIFLWPDLFYFALIISLLMLKSSFEITLLTRTKDVELIGWDTNDDRDYSWLVQQQAAQVTSDRP